MREHPLVHLTAARLREFVREPGALFWVFIFPVLLAIALGIAFRSQPEARLQVAVVSGSPGARLTADRLRRAPGLAVKLLTPAEADRALRVGKVDLVIVVAAELGPDGRPRYELRFDPARPEGKAARAAADDALQRALGRRDVAVIEARVQTRPGARYIDFLIPGLLGLNLMGSALWGIGYVVVQARTRKVLLRLSATPMRRSHYLLSFMISRLAFLVPEVAALVLAGWLLFGVQVHGSVVAVGVVALLGAASFSGVALLVAARTQSVEAASGWMNLVQMPMYLLSGSFFSYERFPEAVRPFIQALPLTALNDALRLVMNEGRSLWHTGPQLLVLLLWGGIGFAVALRVFRWR